MDFSQTWSYLDFEMWAFFETYPTWSLEWNTMAFSKAFLHLKTIIFMISFLNVGLFWGLPYLIIAEAYSSILIALSIETMLTNYATILLYKASSSSIYYHYARGGFTSKLRRVKYGKRIGNRVKRVKFIWLKRFGKVGDIYRGICNPYPFLKPPYICIK